MCAEGFYSTGGSTQCIACDCEPGYSCLGGQSTGTKCEDGESSAGGSDRCLQRETPTNYLALVVDIEGYTASMFNEDVTRAFTSGLRDFITAAATETTEAKASSGEQEQPQGSNSTEEQHVTVATSAAENRLLARLAQLAATVSSSSSGVSSSNTEDVGTIESDDNSSTSATPAPTTATQAETTLDEDDIAFEVRSVVTTDELARYQWGASEVTVFISLNSSVRAFERFLVVYSTAANASDSANSTVTSGSSPETDMDASAEFVATLRPRTDAHPVGPAAGGVGVGGRRRGGARGRRAQPLQPVDARALDPRGLCRGRHRGARGRRARGE